MSPHDTPAGGVYSIRRLRTLILIALITGVSGFTAIMFTLVHSLSEQFGPQVSADLEWRALRGATELSNTAVLGLAVSDPAMTKESFGAYAESSDVAAIVAIDAHGQVVARHGAFAALATVFAAPPGTLVHGDGYVASWARSVIEGSEVGKIAVVVSTARLADAQTVLSRVSDITLAACVVGAILGALVIVFFTRAVSIRDGKLGDYAQNLERKVEDRTRELDERNRGLRLVLDTVAQGFITIDLDGVMASERSAIVDRWFGVPAAGATFSELVGSAAADFAGWFEFGLSCVRDGYMPLDLCLDQIPKRFAIGAATFDVTYSPIRHDDKLDRLLLIISDVTDQIAGERAEREQREIMTLFQRIAADRAGFEEFLDDAGALVGALAAPGDPVIERRTIHTLKGNCGIYGLESYAELCHTIESELAETLAPLSDTQRAALAAGWHKVTQRMAQLLGGTRRNVVEVELPELARVVEQAAQGMASRDLAAVLTSWSYEPVARRFDRLAGHASSLARRLGKSEVEVEVADDGIRLDAPRWAAFWAAMVHAVRNAVDHGIEPPETRVAAGKPERSKLTLRAVRAHGRVVISVSDDGAGVDWQAVHRRARSLGLPAESPRDLEQALFVDGLSTREAATDTSGRGVGLAALREAVAALGGTIELESELGRGTTVRCQFPDLDDQLPHRRLPPELRTA